MLLQYSGITKNVQIGIDHTMQPTNQISGIKCFNVGCVPLAKYIIKISIVNQINATSRQCVHETAYAQILVMEGQKKMN